MNLENLIFQVSQIQALAKTLKPYQGLKQRNRTFVRSQQRFLAKTLKPYQGLKVVVPFEPEGNPLLSEKP
jgi:hypothetical protein